MSYNNKIQIIIDKMGLSQKDFANKLGVSQNAISHYLLGKRNPDINTIQKLIDLGVSPLFLFSNSKNPFDETYKLFSEANKYLNEDNKNELISPMNEFIRKYNLINVIKSKIEKIKGQNFFQKIIQEFSNRGERIIKLLYYFIIYIEESQKDFDFLNIKNSFITELEKFKLSKKDKIVSFETVHSSSGSISTQPASCFQRSVILATLAGFKVTFSTHSKASKTPSWIS